MRWGRIFIRICAKMYAMNNAVLFVALAADGEKVETSIAFVAFE